VRGTLRGSLVAVPTPFVDGRVDYDALRRLLEHQVSGGSDGIVVTGTTGEAATLTTGERQAIVAFSVGVLRGRLPLVAGVGTSATHETLALARSAECCGADAVLVVTPYYNRPGQPGLAAHFQAVAAALRIPVVLYNVPKRTGVDLEPATVAAIARERPNVVAIKDASGSLERLRELLALDCVDVLCGDDVQIVDGMQAGAHGVVGVAANLAPQPIAELVRTAAPGGDETRAAELAELVAPLIAALSVETNPGPVKHGLARMGLCGDALRSPLVPVEPTNAERIGTALARLGLC